MKKIILSLGKRYLISELNSLLSKYKCNVAVITERLNVWTCRLTRIIEQLKKVNDRVADGKLESSEVEDSIKEIEILVKTF